MSKYDAAEIQVVLKDGTVKRWSGLHAESMWSGMQTADGEYFQLLCLDENKPLRKVTEIDADYLTGYREDPDGFFLDKDERGEPWANMDQRFVPDEICGTPGVIHRFRIVVEAVPVEDKDR